MKLRKLFATLSACAVAVSAMALSASADMTVPAEHIADDGNGTVWLLGASDDGVYQGLFNDTPEEIANISAIKWTISCPGASDPSVWFGGAYGVNCTSAGWSTQQWCVNEETTEKTMATLVSEDVYEVVLENPFGDAEEYACAVFQNYGADVEVTVTLLGVGDEEVEVTTTTTEAVVTTTTAADNGDVADTTTTAADNGDAADTTTTTAAAATTTTAASDSAATGVEGVASVVALLTIAGAAVVVTKKH